MLITQLKPEETIESLLCGKVFVINCHGCKEVRFPEHEAVQLQKQWKDRGIVTGILTTDYVCNPDNLKLRLEKHKAAIEEADAVLVLSCGVGVQTVAEYLDHKRVYAVCDTVALPGYQGVTALEYDCDQCGECYLNITGGICPITACSKSLVNGQCEVDCDMECGWERIYRRLTQVGRLDVLKCPVQVRNYATDEEVSK